MDDEQQVLDLVFGDARIGRNIPDRPYAGVFLACRIIQDQPQHRVVIAVRGHVERVLLTTIHGAKGGEWRVVFVVGVEEGILPHARSLIDQTVGSGGVEDELRVAYVAVTRPRERLYLTCCRQRRSEERHEIRFPSRFLRGPALGVCCGTLCE